MSTLFTKDGTITKHDAETGEWFHNSAGAYLEAVKNYIEPLNLGFWKPDRLSVLDACFGLGYNSLALIEHLCKHENRRIELDLICIDKNREHLASLPEVLNQSCFASIDNRSELADFFESLSRSKDKSASTRYDIGHIELNLTFEVEDIRVALPRMISRNCQLDLVFHDPFSAQKIPSLWTFEIFALYHSLLKAKKGKLLTYSTASGVRGGLESAGFSVYRTVPVGTKIGGTIAACQIDAALQKSIDEQLVMNLDKEEIENMKGRKGVPYRDPEFNLERNEIIRRRQIEQNGRFPLKKPL
ncbi:MAG: MnmC family methyltransferase [Candidatus Melainabacteria bacterium]|nr:MnmC family methyltransferase [Candidatus Melainabacteria bacterium]